MISISSFSAEQKQVIYSIEDGYNILVTGGAGTGKSYILQYLRSNYLDHGLNITASTGVAAVNIGGQTIHSWSGIGLAKLPAEKIIQNLLSPKLRKIRTRIQLAKMLAIDEISMISAYIFDLLDKVLRSIRQVNKPFGGLQIILFGDFLQLPPVNIASYPSDYHFCFQSNIWQELKTKTINLKTVFRQQDNIFVKLLNNLRFNSLTQDDLRILQDISKKKYCPSKVKPTILVSHNSQVEKINQFQLNHISEKSSIFKAQFTGDKNKIDFLSKNCIASSSLELKIGAQVMMLKNTYKKFNIINGSLGVVKDFSKNKGYPIVEFSNNKILTIKPVEWLLEQFDQVSNKMIIEASMVQIPLILSWAITIHKSQGMTLDKIQCDLSKVFSDGQIYVALSRVRDLAGLFINGFNPNKIKVNKNVVNFYKKL